MNAEPASANCGTWVTGGDLVGKYTTTPTVTDGKPALEAFVPAWTTFASKGTFTNRIKAPNKPAQTGSGIYLPKSNSAWGFFLGKTRGGRIELTVQ